MTSSQEFESFVPVYDVVPEKWDDARDFLVEQLKKISNAVNAREIGYFLDEELLSGKQFISAPNVDPPNQFRSVFRKVIDCSPLVPGANQFAHGITFDANFTLTDLWVAATDSMGMTAINMVYSEVDMDAMNININSPAAYDRAFATVEYMKEV